MGRARKYIKIEQDRENCGFSPSEKDALLKIQKGIENSAIKYPLLTYSKNVLNDSAFFMEYECRYKDNYIGSIKINVEKQWSSKGRILTVRGGDAFTINPSRRRRQGRGRYMIIDTTKKIDTIIAMKKSEMETLMSVYEDRKNSYDEKDNCKNRLNVWMKELENKYKETNPDKSASFGVSENYISFNINNDVHLLMEIGNKGKDPRSFVFSRVSFGENHWNGKEQARFDRDSVEQILGVLYSMANKQKKGWFANALKDDTKKEETNV